MKFKNDYNSDIVCGYLGRSENAVECAVADFFALSCWRSVKPLHGEKMGDWIRRVSDYEESQGNDAITIDDAVEFLCKSRKGYKDGDRISVSCDVFRAFMEIVWEAGGGCENCGYPLSENTIHGAKCWICGCYVGDENYYL